MMRITAQQAYNLLPSEYRRELINPDCTKINGFTSMYRTHYMCEMRFKGAKEVNLFMKIFDILDNHEFKCRNQLLPEL